MKKLLTTAAVILALSVVQSFADGWNYNTNQQHEQRRNNYNYQQDNYGNYTKKENLYKDSDGDGVANKYDYNDRNPNVQRRGQTGYSQPAYNYNYGSSYGSRRK